MIDSKESLPFYGNRYGEDRYNKSRKSKTTWTRYELMATFISILLFFITIYINFFSHRLSFICDIESKNIDYDKFNDNSYPIDNMDIDIGIGIDTAINGNVNKLQSMYMKGLFKKKTKNINNNNKKRHDDKSKLIESFFTQQQDEVTGLFSFPIHVDFERLIKFPKTTQSFKHGPIPGFKINSCKYYSLACVYDNSLVILANENSSFLCSVSNNIIIITIKYSAAIFADIKQKDMNKCFIFCTLQWASKK